MMGGTTQPVPGENLRAQVALRQVTPARRNRHRPMGLQGRRTGQTPDGAEGMVGSALTVACPAEGAAPNSFVGCLMLESYPGKPDVRKFRGAVGNAVYGGIANPPAIERAGLDKAST